MIENNVKTATEAILETQDAMLEAQKNKKRYFQNPVSVPVVLSQPEMIDAIVVKVCSRLEPILLKIENKSRRGVLSGAREICEYMDFRTYTPHRQHPITYVYSTKIKRWHDKWGFPIIKNWHGIWFTSKSLIDSWIVSMDLLARKLVSLGYKPRGVRGKGAGRPVYAFPFRFKEEEVAHAQLELRKDKAKGMLDE